jgi:PAS domain S-box-containing protein
LNVRADRSESHAQQRPFGLDLSLEVFDRATRIAQSLFPGSFALAVLVENGVAWRSRRLGDMPIDAEDRAANQVIATGELLWVEDGRLDPRFAQEALVTRPPFLRTWIGQPIRLADGSTPGVLVVVDTQPRPFDRRLAARLQDLAGFVADEWTRAKVAQAHHEASQALDTVRAHMTALADNVPFSLVMTDRDLRVVASSRVWREDRGLTDVPVTGRHISELTPAYGQLAPLYAGRALAGDMVNGGPLRIDRPDGTSVWKQLQATAWRDDHGEVAGLLITGYDVTELKAALNAAERSQERLSLALGLTQVHVWELDYARGELFKAGADDNFFERPLGYDDIHEDTFAAIDPRDRAAVREAWRRHRQEGAPYRPRYRVARSDGKEVWVEGVVQYFRDEAGRPLRLVGAMRNITDDQLAERRLTEAMVAAEAANTAKSQFLATMSHEIRTPLNGVLGMTQAMDADELTPRQRARLQIVRDSGESLLAILNDILDISKIEAGKLELEAAPFDLAEVAESARRAFAALAESKQLALKLEVTPAAAGHCLGDAVRVRQILYNLVSNALKFTERGEVAVKVARRGATVRIEVTDTGIGIAPGDLERLFGKFEQADASTTRRFGGSGLGLAICRQLAQLMGGRVRARSRPGEGARFVVTLRLPVAAPPTPASPAAAPAEPAARSASLRLLAAEDNETNRLVLRTLLGQLGVEPTLVGDGQGAVDAWEGGEWDAILMDVQMPRMDGPTATRAIRQREAQTGRRRTPIIALTANAMSHQTDAYRAAGMDAVVAKPIQVGELFAARCRARSRRRRRASRRPDPSASSSRLLRRRRTR